MSSRFYGPNNTIVVPATGLADLQGEGRINLPAPAPNVEVRAPFLESLEACGRPTEELWTAWVTTTDDWALGAALERHWNTIQAPKAPRVRLAERVQADWQDNPGVWTPLLDALSARGWLHGDGEIAARVVGALDFRDPDVRAALRASRSPALWCSAAGKLPDLDRATLDAALPVRGAIESLSRRSELLAPWLDELVPLFITQVGTPGLSRSYRDSLLRVLTTMIGSGRVLSVTERTRLLETMAANSPSQQGRVAAVLFSEFVRPGRTEVEFHWLMDQIEHTPLTLARMARHPGMVLPLSVVRRLLGLVHHLDILLPLAKRLDVMLDPECRGLMAAVDHSSVVLRLMKTAPTVEEGSRLLDRLMSLAPKVALEALATGQVPQGVVLSPELLASVFETGDAALRLRALGALPALEPSGVVRAV